MKKIFALSLSDVVFIMLINVKVPTTVSILTFISRINFVLIPVEHGKKFYNLGARMPTHQSKQKVYYIWLNTSGKYST